MGGVYDKEMPRRYIKASARAWCCRAPTTSYLMAGASMRAKFLRGLQPKA